MDLIAEIRDYIWLFPFIGAILVAIGLFTPAAYETEGPLSTFIWMFGFTLRTGGINGPDSFIFDVPGYVIPGVISTIFLIACAIILFESSLTHRGTETPGSWIALGILLIGGAIYFIVGVEVGYAIYFFNETGNTEWISFWNDTILNPGFAVIAPFIGGGLTLLGAILGKTIGRREGIIKPQTIPTVVKPAPITETPPPIPHVEEPKGYRFCPECGTEVKYEDSRFCSICGYRLTK
ncbi:MAG: zinc ribbon domain-containing protein [Promethearchaeota archaeon]